MIEEFNEVWFNVESYKKSNYAEDLEPLKWHLMLKTVHYKKVNEWLKGQKTYNSKDSSSILLMHFKTNFLTVYPHYFKKLSDQSGIALYSYAKKFQCGFLF
jgi:hypothetical protein